MLTACSSSLLLISQPWLIKYLYDSSTCFVGPCSERSFVNTCCNVFQSNDGNTSNRQMSTSSCLEGLGNFSTSPIVHKTKLILFNVFFFSSKYILKNEMSLMFFNSLFISGIVFCSKLLITSMYIGFISASLSSVCSNDVSHSIVPLYSLR